MLNKKHKCPVCGNKAVNVFFLSFDKFTCSNCDSHLFYSKRSINISCLSYLLLAFPALLFDTVIHPVVTMWVSGCILTWLYLVLFGELEEYTPVKIKIILNEFLDDLKTPKFNLNKFLDNLKNSNCEK